MEHNKLKILSALANKRLKEAIKRGRLNLWNWFVDGMNKKYNIKK